MQFKLKDTDFRNLDFINIVDIHTWSWPEPCCLQLVSTHPSIYLVLQYDLYWLFQAVCKYFHDCPECIMCCWQEPPSGSILIYIMELNTNRYVTARIPWSFHFKVQIIFILIVQLILFKWCALTSLMVGVMGCGCTLVGALEVALIIFLQLGKMSCQSYPPLRRISARYIYIYIIWGRYFVQMYQICVPIYYR